MCINQIKKFLSIQPAEVLDRYVKMTDIPYEKGTIKVVWIEDDPEKIYSKMFEGKKEAEEFTKEKKDYLVFSLEKQSNMEKFAWKLLPYGRYKLYLRLIRGLSVLSV